jgi:hypothetical protein
MFSCFQASQELFVINVLEIANNCLLVNYRAFMWGFVSSGMFCVHSEAIYLLKLNCQFDTEIVIIWAWSKCIATKPRNMVSHPRRLYLWITLCEDLKTWNNACVEWKGVVWDVENVVIKFLDNIITHSFHKDKFFILIFWGECGILFIHRYFCDMKIPEPNLWKAKKDFLDINSIYTFLNRFQTLCPAEQLKPFFSISLDCVVVWLVWTVTFHMRIFLDLK